MRKSSRHPNFNDAVTDENLPDCIAGFTSQYGKVIGHYEVFFDHYNSWKRLGSSYLEVLTSTPEHNHKHSNDLNAPKQLSPQLQGLTILVQNSLHIDQEIDNLRRILMRLQTARTSLRSLGHFSVEELAGSFKGMIDNLTSQYQQIREDLTNASAKLFRDQK
ncbi:MAG TPA: hypothetical protein VJH37_02285 [Candidatus Nanoarchaeia archaeon]|nr:hypothetical protein [Candidatus Nanoarchaeia archaeon]